MCVVGGLNPFETLGQPAPGWYTWLLGNKLYACLMVFFIGNAIETQLVSTGAFEVLSTYYSSAILHMLYRIFRYRWTACQSGPR